MGAMHDSQHRDLVNNFNHTRNLIRTVAQNELRMEDRDGFEHIRLTTPFQTSELSLGHMVDANSKERGQGVELRTDEHMALRGAKGVFLSADSQYGAQGKQLDMESVQKLLGQALEQTEALAGAAKAAQAIVPNYGQQKVFLDGTLTKLQQAGVLVSGPSGVGIVSGGHLQVSAAQNLIATAAADAEIGTMGGVAVTAGGPISMLAGQQGMKLFAAKGDVAMQAQSGKMALAAQQELTIACSDGKVVVSAEKEVWIGAGGSYIRISGDGIENCTPRAIRERCASWGKSGPASMQPVLPLLPKAICIPCLLAKLSQGALRGKK